jgi:hypothetical protein
MCIASPTLTTDMLCVYVNSRLMQGCTLPYSWNKSGLWANSGCSGASSSHRDCQAGC